MEIAILESFRNLAPYTGAIFLLIAFFFVWRLFHGMRIPLWNENPKKEIIRGSACGTGIIWNKALQYQML